MEKLSLHEMGAIEGGKFALECAASGVVFAIGLFTMNAMVAAAGLIGLAAHC